MADEETEDIEQSLAGKRFLFPIVAANNEDKRDAKEIKPLFPSVPVGRSEEKGKKISDIDNVTFQHQIWFTLYSLVTFTINIHNL